MVLARYDAADLVGVAGSSAARCQGLCSGSCDLLPYFFTLLQVTLVYRRYDGVKAREALPHRPGVTGIRSSEAGLGGGQVQGAWLNPSLVYRVRQGGVSTGHPWVRGSSSDRN